MTTRPAMNAWDSSGRNISLLNNEDSTPIASIHHPSYSRYEDNYGVGCSKSYPSGASSLSAPDLLRSDSYNSQNTYDLASPITPIRYDFKAHSTFQQNIAYPGLLEYEQKLECHSTFDACPSKTHSSGSAMRSPCINCNSANLYNKENITKRGGSGKRYPCRYKDSHQCNKTFTTSGHASRHSKVHMAEKAVHCNYPGCQTKFNRTDNMRQHLKTHFKGTRASSAVQKMSSSKVTIAVGEKKAIFIERRTSHPSNRTETRRAEMHSINSATFNT